MGGSTCEIYQKGPMRVLWFTNTPSNYYSTGHGYNGGGWISSLEDEMRSEVELGIAFSMNGEPRRAEKDGVVYYPVPNPYNRSRSDRMMKFVFGNRKETSWLLSHYLEVIKNFRPDVIEVFGSEHLYGLVSEYTPVPVVLHLQGFLGEYEKVFLPPGMSMRRFCMSEGTVSGWFAKRYYVEDFHRRALTEKRILASTDHFIGRTEWDRKVSASANPSADYHLVNEILRGPFYSAAGNWRPSGSGRIVTTISEAPYKGMDIVLRAAEALKKAGVRFEWEVYGNVNAGFFERFTGIRCCDVNVRPMGVADAAGLADALLSCSAYVHPTYADNSPNSVCEAQMLGVPVVATRVGGVPSLISDGVDGRILGVDDICGIAAAVKRYLYDEEYAAAVGAAAAATASVRHDRSSIVAALKAVYGDISGCGSI